MPNSYIFKVKGSVTPSSGRQNILNLTGSIYPRASLAGIAKTTDVREVHPDTTVVVPLVANSHFTFTTCSYHSHRRKSQFTEDELRGRRALGSELARLDPRRVVEEDLENRDIAAIASHRMDPLTGLSMHKISRTASITPFGQPDINKAASFMIGGPEAALTSLEAENKPRDLVGGKFL